MKIVDMHCDTVSALYDKKSRGGQEELRENGGHIDLLRMKKSGYLLQNFALFVELNRDGDPWERALRLYGYYREELEKNGELLAPVLGFSDIGRNEAQGKLSAMLTVEEGAVCEGETDKLRRLYDMGVRMLTLTWNFENELGCPNFTRALKERISAVRAEREALAEAGDTVKAGQKHKELQELRFRELYETPPNVTGGLTEKGREFVSEMEELGMIPDVSHLSDAGFYDVLETAKKPFVASHSNARSICGCVRNLTDDMIRRLAERGGCTGLNFCADFLEQMPAGIPNPGTVSSVVRHARHIVRVGGIEVLGLGSDFDGIDTHAELPGAQSMGVLWEALRRGGFTEGQLDKIFCGNVLRVYGETLKG